MSYDRDGILSDFPALQTQVNGQRLVYLDSAATTLKPKPVIEKLSHFYLYQAANVHRGSHYLSDRATERFEQARSSIAQFIGAGSAQEVVFTRGTTESINLVAESWGEKFLQPGDEILLTELEHHSNIVPWQLIAEKKGARILAVPILDNGALDLKALDSLLSKKTKMVAVTVCSNALGTLNPVQEMVKKAHAVGAKVLLDAAQSVGLLKTNVREWDADFLAFSGHKILGPTGIGILWAKGELLKAMPPYQGGGSMISEVNFKKTTFLEPPQRFEAGTPHIAGVIGLAAAIEYIEGIGLSAIYDHDVELLKLARQELSKIPGLHLYGGAEPSGPIVSFNIEGIHFSDVGSLLNQQGVAVRVGHHCCQPLMNILGVTGTVRASFSVYNTVEDVQRLVMAIKKAKEFF